MDCICEAIARKEKNGYASDAESNGLFAVNLETEEATFLQLFPGELAGKRRLHCCAKWVDEKVFFVPASGSHIFVWEIDASKMVSLPVPDPDVALGSGYNHKMKFRAAVERDGALWCIPDTYPGAIKVDIQSFRTEICETPPEISAAVAGEKTLADQADKAWFAICNAQERTQALVVAAIEEKGILRENASLGLTDWLNVIAEEGKQ